MSVTSAVSRLGPITAVQTVVERIGQSDDDSDEVRLHKRVLVAGALMGIPVGIVWSAIYLSFDEPLAATIPVAYSLVSIAAVVHFGLTKRYYLFRVSQHASLLVLPFVLMIALGGFINGSAVVLWSFFAPLGALLAAGRRQSVGWFIAFLLVVAASIVLEPFARESNNLPRAVIALFFAMNLVGVSTIAFVLVQYFVGQKNTALHLLGREQERSERLLLNVLPAEIAQMLKDDSRTIADHFDAVSVLFADVVGFTPLSARMAPARMVELLNEIFSHFDSLVDRYALEKIRTIGDNYMVASGVPRPRDDHAVALAAMALDMNGYVADSAPLQELRLQFRIGINSGAVVAGVIGQKKFHYDIWGDAVNTASRMESHGLPGKIQVSQVTYELIRDEYECEPRGKVDVKGKGHMDTWFLEGVRS